MDTRPLKVKALELAIKEIVDAETREKANAVYKKWSAFHQDPDFINAIKRKQKNLHDLQ